MPIERFSAVPANEHFGLELLSAGDGRATIRAPLQPWFLQELGVVHGGIITTLLDTACVYAMISAIPPESSITSVELKVNFLSAGKPADGDLTAHGEVLRTGRQLIVCQGEVLQNGRPLAVGLLTYLRMASS